MEIGLEGTIDLLHRSFALSEPFLTAWAGGLP